jgi:predicted glutamine amidotransferase
MCIAIYHDPYCALDRQEFENSWRNNPDGGGFSYFNKQGKPVIQKFMFKSDMYEAYYRAVEKYEESPFLVHFRIATHGQVNEDNAHPHRVNENMTLIHNGIIPVLMEKTEKRSDTRVFVDEYLSKLPHNWVDDEELFHMVEEFIGWSKIVLLNSDSRLKQHVYILNEQDGHWAEDGKTWYSNSSYSTCVSKSLSKWVRPADLDKEYDQAVLGSCIMCAEPAVFDDICYQCETCQLCSYTERECKCVAGSVHSMTEQEWANVAAHGGWEV